MAAHWLNSRKSGDGGVAQQRRHPPTFGFLLPRPGQERGARFLVLGILLGLPLAALAARWLPWRPAGLEVRARIAEAGGWLPGDLKAQVGQPLDLRLTSDDVLHGFAVGQMDWPAVDVMPGEWSTFQAVFDAPGKYVYYCTRWCGPGHWRMRGTIEVTGASAQGAVSLAGEAAVPPEPLYVTLGLSIDAPHPVPAESLPLSRPSAQRGGALNVRLPETFLTADYYRSQSPYQAWQALREARGDIPGNWGDEPGEAPLITPISGASHLSDAQIWDLVAWLWRRQAGDAALAEGRALYAANCAACHGESGRGDGVMASVLAAQQAQHAAGGLAGHMQAQPVDFTDPASALGAAPAVWQGKVLRGGMGTNMPYFGPIFTEDQTWALVHFLWSFQFD